MAQAAGISALVVLVTVAAAVGYAIHRLRRRNRVSPRRRTLAPINWLWSFRPTARLHRRLRAAVLTSRAALRVGHDGHQPWPALVELAADVEQQACAIDERLVLAARAPVALRRKLVIDLTVQVVEVEHVTGRIVRLANRGDHRRPDHATSVKQIRERLDALDDALVELEGPAIPITEPAPVIELTPGEARPPLAWLPPAPRRRSGGRARGTSAR